MNAPHDKKEAAAGVSDEAVARAVSEFLRMDAATNDDTIEQTMHRVLTAGLALPSASPVGDDAEFREQAEYDREILSSLERLLRHNEWGLTGRFDEIVAKLCDKLRAALAAPLPADGLRGLVQKWRDEAVQLRELAERQFRSTNPATCACAFDNQRDADWLESSANQVEAALASIPVHADPVAVSDRVMLSRVLVDLNFSSWECPQCGHSEDCATMDVAHMIRDHLGVTPSKQDPSLAVGQEVEK